MMKDFLAEIVAERTRKTPRARSMLGAGGDAKLSTLQRYCAAIGEKIAVAI